MSDISSDGRFTHKGFTTVIELVTFKPDGSTTKIAVHYPEETGYRSDIIEGTWSSKADARDYAMAKAASAIDRWLARSGR
ncbi:hypothetical protein [Stutzerimonas nitrititolerans]|uniref:hypothetical protein n=1 Tax=Stutzerimonas nitrititolerans TaxID=2482751 RepID=UPI0028ABAB9F|nr:hypothetical protein [Stutzerimonas nitrititolerans]